MTPEEESDLIKRFKSLIEKKAENFLEQNNISFHSDAIEEILRSFVNGYLEGYHDAMVNARDFINKQIEEEEENNL